MPHHDLVLGLDVGTTNINCLVLDGTGIVVAQTSQPTPQSDPRPGWTDFEPGPLWEAACLAMRAVSAQVVHPEAIKGPTLVTSENTRGPLDLRQPRQCLDRGADGLELVMGVNNIHLG
jgi:glycerol kinase